MFPLNVERELNSQCLFIIRHSPIETYVTGIGIVRDPCVVGESDIIEIRLFQDLGILSSVKISRLNLIGQVNRMVSTRKVSKVLNHNPQGSRLKGRPKYRSWNCVHTDINRWKIEYWKER